jgi:alpha-D-xyloside xylohydrolase
MDFAADKNTHDISNEYLFGNSILVAPVVDPMYASNKDTEDYSQVKTKPVYLPKGSDWIDFWTGEKQAGGQTVQKAAPIDIIPLYVKAGSIIPWGPKVQYATEKKWSKLEIRVYPGANGEFTLYEDENDNYNYEKGLNSSITMKWDDQLKTLTIGDQKGSFKGMLKSRTFNIILVSQQNGTGVNQIVRFTKTVQYNGKAKSVKLSD